MDKEINIPYEASHPSENKKVPLVLNSSEGERSSIKARQIKVSEALQKLGINAREDKEPPIIAVLGSGGGLRAMVGFLGTLAELAEEDLLDIITYVCGVSGSTWCMSSLYNNDKWSSCMKEMENQISDRLTNSTWDISKAWEKLKEAFSKEIYSLTSFWAYVVVHQMTKQIDEKPLSNHQASCESGENPYPIYSAVEKRLIKKNEPGAWFEFTPHLAGFPAYKSYVNTELIGSQFKGGDLLKNHPENDLCYLQGLWGSAPSTDDLIQEVIKAMFRKIFPGSPIKGTRSNQSGFESSALRKENPVTFHAAECLHPDLEYCSCSGCQKLMTLLSRDLTEMTDEEIEKFYHEIAADLEGTMETDPLAPTFGAAPRMFNITAVCEKVKVMYHILKSFNHWKWGTTNNFLYEWKTNVPDDLYSQECICLVDAGLEINSAYPLMLPPNRKVDLILSFDFSEGDPFLTLKTTAEYCKKNGIPFPKINIDDKEMEIPSKSVYVFEGDDKGAPDVMHFPLFNNQNCEGKVDEMRKKFTTLKLSYGESELKELLRVSKLNVELSKKQILEKLQQRN
ncbi:cytosolic phospholipase A2 gamma-like [Mixophyes fleayi]|uniref:cytosolic phospholipase A2 gamma-like n=1 Tax=Mixophyes fleayi TaxID=3061075 RepID=UPI003F4DAFC6